MVYGLVSGANRDPRVYDRPDEFIVDRKANNHLGFAGGPHRCLGAHLARMVMQVAVEEWLKVIPDFEVASEAPAHGARRRRDDDAAQPPADLGGAGMKLTVSAELCRGHGRCYTVAPDLLEDDDDEGFVTVRGQVDRRAGRPGRRRAQRRRLVPGAGDPASSRTDRARGQVAWRPAAMPPSITRLVPVT